MPVSDTLYAAADLIEFHGLAKNKYEDATGRIDVLEALFRAATGLSQSHYAKLRDKGQVPITLNDHNKYRWAVLSLRGWLKAQDLEQQPALWSDSCSQEQVIIALRECAAYKEAGH